MQKANRMEIFYNSSQRDIHHVYLAFFAILASGQEATWCLLISSSIGRKNHVPLASLRGTTILQMYTLALNVGRDFVPTISTWCSPRYKLLEFSQIYNFFVSPHISPIHLMVNILCWHFGDILFHMLHHFIFYYLLLKPQFTETKFQT